MRCGLAVWNYKTPDLSLPDLVERCADGGFDAVSLSMQALAQTEAAEIEEVADALRRHALAATLHASFERTPAELERVLALLGESVAALTFDAAKVTEAGQVRFDTARMVPLLQEVERLTRGSGAAFAVEDFPLSAPLLEAHRAELAPLLECPRYGILIDVGHMNMRRHASAEFQGLSVAGYLGGVPLPIVEVHLHDNLGDRDSHGYFGFGNVDFAQVAAGLRSANFDAVATIEIAPRFHGSTPAESWPLALESLRLWRRWWEAAG